MRKKKNKVARLTEKDYQNYISSLKDETPTKAIVDGVTVEFGEELNDNK